MGVLKIYFKFVGFMVRFRNIDMTVLKCSFCSSFSGGQRVCAYDEIARNSFQLFSNRKGKCEFTLQSRSIFKEYIAFLRSIKDSKPRIILLFSVLLWFNLFLFKQNISFSFISSSIFLAISLYKEKFSSLTFGTYLFVLSILTILRGFVLTSNGSSSYSSNPK